MCLQFMEPQGLPITQGTKRKSWNRLPPRATLMLPPSLCSCERINVCFLNTLAQPCPHISPGLWWFIIGSTRNEYGLLASVCPPPPLSILRIIIQVIFPNCIWLLSFSHLRMAVAPSLSSIKCKPLTPYSTFNLRSRYTTRKFRFFFWDYNVYFSFFCLSTPSHPYLCCRVAWAMLPPTCAHLCNSTESQDACLSLSLTLNFPSSCNRLFYVSPLEPSLRVLDVMVLFAGWVRK